MNLIRPGVLGLVVLLATGCSAFQTRTDTSPTHVQRLISNGDYAEAQYLLRNIPPQHPERDRLLALKAQLTEASAAFERRTEKLVLGAQQKGDWREAITQLRAAQKQLPDSAALEKLEDEIESRQRAQLKRLDAYHLINESRFQHNEVELLERARQIDPFNQFLGWRLSIERGHLDKLHGDLLEQAQQAKSQSDDPLLKDLLSAARQLKAPEKVAPADSPKPAKVEARAQPLQRARPTAEDPRQTEQLQKLLTTAETQMAERQLANARTTLNLAIAIDPGSESAQTALQQVEEAILHETARLMQEGNRLYRLGDVTEARAAWREVLELDPDHATARAAIQRASTVIDNVERLRKEQQSR